MRHIILPTIAAFGFSIAAYADSPMEREMASKSFYAKPVYAVAMPEDNSPATQPENTPAPAQHCSGDSWFSPLIQAAGSIVGGLAGNYVGGGAGQQAATIAGGALGGVATNQAMKAACEQQAAK